VNPIALRVGRRLASRVVRCTSHCRNLEVAPIASAGPASRFHGDQLPSGSLGVSCAHSDLERCTRRKRGLPGGSVPVDADVGIEDSRPEGALGPVPRLKGQHTRPQFVDLQAPVGSPAAKAAAVWSATPGRGVVTRSTAEGGDSLPTPSREVTCIEYWAVGSRPRTSTSCRRTSEPEYASWSSAVPSP
jgi:hypothetical protein